VSRYIIKHCRHAMLQTMWPPSWLSLGVHIDPMMRWHARSHQYCGPYLDVHLLFCIISFGYNCYLGQDDDIRGRGGVT
jgi:hypothetical protein